MTDVSEHQQYAYVCSRDPVSATFQIWLTGPYADEDEDDHLHDEPEGMQQLVSSAHRIKDAYIFAAETIPAELLGVFEAHDRFAERSVQVGVDPEDMKVFMQLGYDEAEFDLYPSGPSSTRTKLPHDA